MSCNKRKVSAYLSFVDAHGCLVAGSSVFESPCLQVLDDVAASERQICLLRLDDALARVFFGIG